MNQQLSYLLSLLSPSLSPSNLPATLSSPATPGLITGANFDKSFIFFFKLFHALQTVAHISHGVSEEDSVQSLVSIWSKASEALRQLPTSVLQSTAWTGLIRRRQHQHLLLFSLPALRTHAQRLIKLMKIFFHPSPLCLYLYVHFLHTSCVYACAYVLSMCAKVPSPSYIQTDVFI